MNQENSKTKMYLIWALIGILALVIIFYLGRWTKTEKKDLSPEVKKIENTIKSLENVIAEKDNRIEQLQRDVLKKEYDIKMKEKKYQDLIGQMKKKIEESKTIKKAEGKDEITEGFKRHNINPVVRE